MDRTAWAILHELQQDARISFSELGRRVGLTPPAVADRVKRMHRDGVLVGFRAELDMARLGLGVEAVVLLRVSDHGMARRFERELPTVDGVLRCDRVTGPESYMLRVVASSIADLEDKVLEFGPYGRVETWVVLSTPAHSGVVETADDPGRGRVQRMTDPRDDVPDDHRFHGI
jgi:Lrp/AsnC family leucine-responsive transcriptional regulator